MRFLLCIGNTLISLCDEGHLKAWNLNKQHKEGYGGEEGSGAAICDAALEGGFVPTAMAHPPTYLNKVVVGSEGGSLQLWNVRTGRYASSSSLTGVRNPPSSQLSLIFKVYSVTDTKPGNSIIEIISYLKGQHLLLYDMIGPV